MGFEGFVTKCFYVYNSRTCFFDDYIVLGGDILDFFRYVSDKFSKKECHYHYHGNGGQHIECQFRGGHEDENDSGDHYQYLSEEEGEIGGESILDLGNIGAETAKDFPGSIFPKKVHILTYYGLKKIGSESFGHVFGYPNV